MISIFTAENIEDLKNYHQSTSHYDVLWLPENECHANTEAKKIISFVLEHKDSPHIEIYTLRETTVNIVGHLILGNLINNEDVKITILPEKIICKYDKEGYLLNWRYGFFDWDYNEIFNP
jgi:hypothetical protein